MLHEALWRENEELARACREHPFVRGLAAGTLEPAAFQTYVAQDVFYLRAFFRAYALAAARAAARHAETLHRFMGGVFDELRLHAGYAAELGIDLGHVRPLPACRAYTDFLLRTAWHNSVGETLAALTPCMRLYAWLGQELAPLRRADHPYERWIANYSSPAFTGLAAEVEALLDAVADDTPGVHEAYRYALQCELDFFAQPLEAHRPGLEWRE